MTVSEFETLRAELAALRTDMSGLRTDMDGLRTDMETRLLRVEAKLDEKPGYAALYQVAFGAPLALVGCSAALIGIVKAAGLL